MKATEQFFPLELFIMLYKVVLTFESVGEILNNIIVTIYGKWKLLRRSSLWLLCCTRWFKLFGHWIKSQSVTIQMKATDQYFPVIRFILYIVVLSCDDVHVIDTCLSLCFISHENWFFFFPQVLELSLRAALSSFPNKKSNKFGVFRMWNLACSIKLSTAQKQFKTKSSGSWGCRRLVESKKIICIQSEPSYE